MPWATSQWGKFFFITSTKWFTCTKRTPCSATYPSRSSSAFSTLSWNFSDSVGFLKKLLNIDNAFLDFQAFHMFCKNLVLEQGRITAVFSFQSHTLHSAPYLSFGSGFTRSFNSGSSSHPPLKDCWYHPLLFFRSGVLLPLLPPGPGV